MLNVLLRTFFMYLLVILIMRLMGKRQLGQLSPSELVATIIISELAAMPIADESMPLHHPAGAIAIILFIELATSVIAMKSIKMRHFFNGKPSVLIHQGKIMRTELWRNRLTIDELIDELRQKDVTDLNEVQYAIMERSGVLSVIKRPSLLPTILISDGRILKNNMNYIGVSEQYVKDELKIRGIKDVRDVFLLMLDEQHTFYVYTQDQVS